MQKWAEKAFRWMGLFIKDVLVKLFLCAAPVVIGFLAMLANAPPHIVALSFLGAIVIVLAIIYLCLKLKREWKKDVSKLSEKDLEKLIREWIDIPLFAVERQPKTEKAKFNFLIKQRDGKDINIARPEQDSDILQLIARVQIPPLDHPFSDPDLFLVAGKVKLELARLGIQYKFDGSPNPHSAVTLVDNVVLDESLTKFYLRERILFVDRAMILVMEVGRQAAIRGA